MEVRVAAVTVRAAVPLMEPEVARMVEEPAATPVAIPVEAIVALVVSELVQVTDEVISAVELSE